MAPGIAIFGCALSISGKVCVCCNKLRCPHQLRAMKQVPQGFFGFTIGKSESRLYSKVTEIIDSPMMAVPTYNEPLHPLQNKWLNSLKITHWKRKIIIFQTFIRLGLFAFILGSYGVRRIQTTHTRWGSTSCNWGSNTFR